MFSFRHWLHRAAFCGAMTGAFFSAQGSSVGQELRPAALGAPVPDRALPAAETPPVVPVPTLPTGAEKAKDPVAEAVPVAAPPTPVSAWLTHPNVRATPRPGYFPMLPTGPGYYSLLDAIHGNYREAPPKSAHPRHFISPTPFFDADYRYIDAPGYDPDFLERLHRVHLGDNWLFGTGGQIFGRHVHETSSRLTGRTNDFDLIRARIYADVWYKDIFRFHVEFLSAHTANQDLPPLLTDEDRFDFQNLFVDIKLFEIGCQPVYVRAGRQELLFGSQRVISPPDWNNTRRTFQGVRLFRQSEKFDFDLFWVQPVIPNNTKLDTVDHHQNFYGAWATYRPQKGQVVDTYYLFLDNSNTRSVLGVNLAPTSVHTVGSRYAGDKNHFLWDFEGMFQFGQRGPSSITAGSATAGLGYNFANAPMNPTFWAYYDWASGDHDPTGGNYTTFNQLFPFGHYYLGWLDQVARQNIRDVNMHLYLYPTKWITVNVQYHFFALDSARDALYNATGAPIRVSPNGTAGGTVGRELDVIVNFHLSNRVDIISGYSKLYAGDFISNTGNGRSPEFWYVGYSLRW